MEYAYLGWHHAIAHGILTDSFICIYYILCTIVAHLLLLFIIIIIKILVKGEDISLIKPNQI